MKLIILLSALLFSSSGYAEQYLTIKDHWLVGQADSYETAARSNLLAETNAYENFLRSMEGVGIGSYHYSFNCTNEARCQLSGGQYYCGCVADQVVYFDSTWRTTQIGFSISSPYGARDYYEAFKIFQNACENYIYQQVRRYGASYIGGTCGLPVSSGSSGEYRFSSTDGVIYVKR